MQWDKLNPSDIAATFNAANGEIQIIRSFMALLAKSGIKCAIEDAGGRLLYLNGAALKDWHVKNNGYHGKSIPALLELASGFEVLKHNRRIIAKQRPVIFFVVAVNQKGGTEVYTMFKFPIWDADEDLIVGLIMLPGTSHHVTEIKS